MNKLEHYKAFYDDMKINQWKFHNALAFFRLITV